MLIEIFSDLICPWCYIGHRRLERALVERPSLAAERRWLPFQLNPQMPPEGMDRSLYLSAKFGSLERARQVYTLIERAAEGEGLPLRLDRIRRTPNTLDAHRLVRFVGQPSDGDSGDGDSRARQTARMTMTLYRAYFQDGLDIGDRAVLADLAAEIGLNRQQTTDFLAGDAETAAVRASDLHARQLGIQAVPCIIVNRRYALAGAQETAAILPLLDLDIQTGMTPPTLPTAQSA